MTTPGHYELPPEISALADALLPSISIVRGAPRKRAIRLRSAPITSASHLCHLLDHFSPDATFAYWAWRELLSGRAAATIEGAILQELEYRNRKGEASPNLKTQPVPPNHPDWRRKARVLAFFPRKAYTSEPAYWAAMREIYSEPALHAALVSPDLLDHVHEAMTVPITDPLMILYKPGFLTPPPPEAQEEPQEATTINS